MFKDTVLLDPHYHNVLFMNWTVNKAYSTVRSWDTSWEPAEIYLVVKIQYTAE